MTLWQSVILGIIQGLTEFFPISSSAHIHLISKWLSFPPSDSLFDLVCHLGTLGALCLYLRKEIIVALQSKEQLGKIALALLPLIFTYKIIHSFLPILSSIRYLGFFFCISAVLLYIAAKKNSKTYEVPFTYKKDAFWIGIFQSLALIPGISRSAATISAGRMRGWTLHESVIFSFLLSIPTILGGIFLELWKSNSHHAIFRIEYVGGALASFLVGLGTINLFFKILQKGRLILFAIYCMILGSILLLTYG